LGADVTIVYRRERNDMPAIPEEIEAAEHEGAKLVYLASPHRILGDADGRVRAIEVVRTKLGEFDTSGRRRPVPTDEVIRIDCDTVILAVGEKVDPDFCRASGLKVKEAGTLEVDRYSLETSRERFYAGGDLITGASNVSNAMGYGKKAARNIDRRLTGREDFQSLIPDFVYQMEPPETPGEHARHVPAEMPAAQRVQSYAEVSLGLTAVAARQETSRCLRCDVRGVER
jgi:NADH-quinone oxidoreductase subunit F